MIYGTIWKYDHLEQLDYYEYLYWMQNPLPMGWQIISKPIK